MSLRAIGGKLIKHGTTIIKQANRGKVPGKPPTRAICHSVAPLKSSAPVRESEFLQRNKYYVFRNLGIQVTQKARRVLIEDVLNRVGNKTESGVLHKSPRNSFFGNSAPLLSLVGVAAVGQGLLTKDEELEGVCWEIRQSMSKIQWNRMFHPAQNTAENSPMNLEGFTFGKPIAKGANAVVYEVATNIPNNVGGSTEFPLALKMMFNYDIQSNSLAILKAMHRETVPAPVYFNCHGIADYELSFLNMTRHLPPHPNIVKILSVFTDYIPELEKCREMYPAALPKRIDPAGEGRNMSLFILMNRYERNLQEFLDLQDELSLRTSVVLLTQLLEGVAHMVAHNIAHRDLKADNILLDLSDAKTPLAVISDFGCCLAEKSTDLSVSYTTFDIEKGGNTALMAPEIISKKPGPFSKLNYHKSDLWAVGAIGFEIFGLPNPFYGDKTVRLSSMTYSDEDLPSLPQSVPAIFNRLLKNLLRRDPGERLNAEIAANVCQLFLWGPSSWLANASKFPSYGEIVEWLLNLTAKVLCESGRKQGNRHSLTYPEYLLISTFLCRVKLQNIKAALAWIRDDEI
ncbi:serine/threonine-protein kinase Pink1, mitochondrial [Dendroctonus ponderosae]|uniref:non-specific serine/threonine protein kinase n=1 Tax=Dendroctonus ponderosae TaxID=77166 RepID=U4UR97_DENPD|nr:serine/threonine-protein kinase Pink1, mitochondrial [Dendroctonus ponderosae]XP_048521514.1 serine/threonine-protein kinase Pink1, mitochondrial [Dendroctonus ponderosae]ERL95033.1 hypothetical protein D910_12303 [Dendroctonus ponderosae]KAH1018294.1 hypothetical protein HUJ05_006095 [Dendroctonus ponderosae]